MPQYLSPGVYVEEVPSAVQPIAGVGTSTAGFVGVVKYSELNANAELLMDRKPLAIVFPVGTDVSGENLAAIKEAIGTGGTVEVSGRAKAGSGFLEGMKLQEEVNFAALPAGTTITDQNVEIIALAVGAEAKINVIRPVEIVADTDPASLIGLTLKQKVTLQDKTVLPIGTLVDDQNARPIIDAVGVGNIVDVSTDPRVPHEAIDLKLEDGIDRQTLPSETELTAQEVKAIVSALGSDGRVRVKGEFSPDQAVGLRLTKQVVLELDSEEDEDFDIKEILKKAAGGGRVRVEPLASVNDPQLLSSFAQFKRRFGDFSSDDAAQNTLVHAVYGFFNNGGTLCWVTRVDSASDAAQVTTALTKFEPIDEIAIVAVPGAVDQAVQVAVISHCENMQDRFAILDGRPEPSNLTVDEIQDDTPDSDYAAMYFPWIEVFDPASDPDAPTKNIFLPPSGHLAGIYARVDNTRGVHKAPANEVIRGALGVQRLVSRAEQGNLNPKGINVIRKFDGNIKVWGARTLGGDDNFEFKYINVRRLLLFLRESIDEGTQWVVFEPNDRDLWAKIRRNVGAFLTNVWRDGALFGSTPEEAFFVKCDDETNPPEVRDLGQVITEIGVAPVKPAEFVIFRIQQISGSAAAAAAAS